MIEDRAENKWRKLPACDAEKRRLEAYATFRRDSNFPFDPKPLPFPCCPACFPESHVRMLTITGRRKSNRDFCIGLSRHGFIQAGRRGGADLMLPALLKANAATSGGGSRRSVTMIYAVERPSYQDMFD
ncbi:MAG: hypothetical protein RIK87_24085 [Fuerstiella sp.]